MRLKLYALIFVAAMLAVIFLMGWMAYQSTIANGYHVGLVTVLFSLVAASAGVSLALFLTITFYGYRIERRA